MFRPASPVWPASWRVAAYACPVVVWTKSQSQPAYRSGADRSIHSYSLCSFCSGIMCAESFLGGWHARARSCNQQDRCSGRSTSNSSSAFYRKDRTESQWLLAYRCDLEKGETYWPGKWPGNQLAAFYTTFPTNHSMVHTYYGLTLWPSQQLHMDGPVSISKHIIFRITSYNNNFVQNNGVSLARRALSDTVEQTSFRSPRRTDSSFTWPIIWAPWATRSAPSKAKGWVSEYGKSQCTSSDSWICRMWMQGHVQDRHRHGGNDGSKWVSE